jgi:hypothetical protein
MKKLSALLVALLMFSVTLPTLAQGASSDATKKDSSSSDSTKKKPPKDGEKPPKDGEKPPKDGAKKDGATK